MELIAETPACNSRVAMPDYKVYEAHGNVGRSARLRISLRQARTELQWSLINRSTVGVANGFEQ